MFTQYPAKGITITLSLVLPLIVVGLLLLGLPALTKASEAAPPPPAPAVDALSPRLQSTVGATFTYQGRLLQGSDAVSGTCDLTFALYDSAEGGTLQGTGTVTASSVSVQDGYFTQPLNFGDSAFNGDARWLEITINSCNGGGSSATLSPRVAVTAAPYAMHADQVPWSGVDSVPAASTDVSGTYPNLTVVGLQTRPVSTTAPAAGQVLQWDGSAWTPAAVSAGTTYSAGDGLLLNGSIFSVDFAGSGALTTTARSDHNHNDAYWNLSGNSGTGVANFVGTTDNMTLTLKVNNQTGLRLMPGGAAGDGTPNVIGGAPDNVSASGIVGGVIGGGGTVSNPNRITANFATVGGGRNNTANAKWATVGGGDENSATGDSATVGGGWGNQAAAYRTTVGGGQSNEASAPYTTIAGGRSNVITGTTGAAAIGGGRDNVITGTANFANIGGGYQNEASGYAATIPGGRAAQASHYGEMAYASGQFADPGDAQTSVYVLRNTTNSDTSTALYLDGTSELLTIADNRVVTFDILVAAAQTDGGNSAGYHFSGVIQNIGGTTSLVGTTPLTPLMESEDDINWGVAVVAGDVNDALVIRVTGSSTHEVRWVATVRTVEVGF